MPILILDRMLIPVWTNSITSIHIYILILVGWKYLYTNTLTTIIEKASFISVTHLIYIVYNKNKFIPSPLSN